jgi:hypothetical protein
MKVSAMTKRDIERQVDELFAKARRHYGECCTNPVTGASYVQGMDRIKPQKEAARRALFNREWFAINGPADAQPLPISQIEWEDARRQGDLLHYILGLYARSLDGMDAREHPPFTDYVSGVLWEAERVNGIIGVLPNFADKAELKKRFPPRKLAGIGPGFCWYSPKAYAEVMPSYRRSVLRGRRAKQRRAEPIKMPQCVIDSMARANAHYGAIKTSAEGKRCCHSSKS